MNIGLKLRELRTTLRKNSQKIMKDVLERHVPRVSFKKKSKLEICTFCGSPNNITKEHVLPRWVFGKCTKKSFTTDINESEQTYNKTTIPACSRCNNNWLANIEKYLVSIFKNTNLDESFFTNHEVQDIIRWLEIIEYKFQIFEIRRKFTKSKSAGYIPYLADIPVSIMREEIDYSPRKAISQIRLSQKRVTVKAKNINENSLLVFKSKNRSFSFFHQMNEFIYIELPEFKIALFYFYSKHFKNIKFAHREAMKIIESVYDS